MKYAQRLEGCNPCPQGSLQPARGVGFRLMKGQGDLACVLPVALESPGRIANAKKDCRHWGISLWRSPDQLRAKMNKLVTKHPRILAVKGNLIGQVDLRPEDGQISADSTDGHFTLYEADDLCLKSRLIEVGRI